ncbi:MAG: glutamyl-tRNA reductase [Bacteroidetes bacterium]|nr:glutamyl-tRNA reductase [Bacteroidota bacterium]
MNLLCIGISHHTAPLEVREKLWFSANEIRGILPLLKQNYACESVLFSTCNRTELYVLTDDGKIEPGLLKKFLIDKKSAADKVQLSDLFILTGGEAARHLFRVSASIDSMVIGDVQILTQIKEGFNLAVELGTAGIFMNRLFQLAFRVGKRARTETEICEGAVSISYAAVELAERIFDKLNEKTAVIIGAGETAELTATHLRSKDLGKLLITNRTYEHACRLASKFEADVLPFDSWSSGLAESDIVISSIETDNYIIQPADIKKANRRHKNVPLFMIDLGVPRNINPDIKKMENVFLYDLDNLDSMISNNLKNREKEIPKVDAIIAEVLDELTQWYSSLEVNPTIIALTEYMESIRKEELEKNINRFDPKDRELAEIITKRIINKIIHRPIINMRNDQDKCLNDRLQKMNIIQKLFGLAGSENKKTHGE